MNPRSLTLLGLTILMVVALGGSPAFAKKEPVEKYEANTFALDGQGGASSSVIHINIYEWSSDDDREEIRDAIEEAEENRRAYRAVPEALRKLGKAGYMFLAGGQGWTIRYAQVIESDGKRQIILATDRPVIFSEIYRGSAVRDYDITLIILEWEGSDKGDGLATVGTEIAWDETEGQMKITNFSSQPVRLGDVRSVE